MIAEEPSTHWKDILGEIEQKIGIRRFNLWFRNLQLISLDNKSANISVPNLFVMTKIRDTFKSQIRDSIKSIANITPSISFHVENKPIPETNQHNQRETKPDKAPEQAATFTNDRRLLLEDFVVGDSNRLAFASALEISKPGPVPFNTLFLHGQIGVGKTHILQGIWNRIKSESSTISAVYMPAESWTNEFIYSLKSGKLESFRKKYRGNDILLVDDVHFLSNKKGVQEEFIHTFNTLHNLSRRVVFASDAHPRLMGQLKESLVSRFMSGMIAKIEEPNFNTALLILRSKAAKLKKKIPDDVLEFISEKFNENVRSMESALTTVLAHANIKKTKINIQLANEVFCELYAGKKKSITLKGIEEVIISHCSVSHSDIHSGNKSRNIALSRQLCMYFAKTLTDASYQEIGRYFGNKRHTTAMFATNKITEKINTDIEFNSLAKRLSKKIQGHNFVI